MPEAAEEIIRNGFEDLGLGVIWCSYHGETKNRNGSKRKLDSCSIVPARIPPVPLLGKYRTRHTNILAKTRWMSLKKAYVKTDNH